MRAYFCVFGIVAIGVAGCARSANVEQERNALLTLDQEWSASAKDLDKFMSYFASDATAYPQGMPVVAGRDAIRKEFGAMSSAPGFAISWKASKAEVAGSGDVGYTTGTSDTTMNGVTEHGKYVTVWKKQSDGTWKVTEDIFNFDAPAIPPAQHVMVAPATLTWMDGPPGLPSGARFAVVSGDPSKAEPFVIRAQVPAGYRVPPHWHPTAENLTVLSGTVALGMGEQFNEGSMTALPTAGYATLPADMRHYFLAKTAATFQVHGIGPFGITYVNPTDDPRRTAK